MNNKNELKAKVIDEIILIEERQFYEDVRLILKNAKEQAYNNASAIMTEAYWNVGARIVEQEQRGQKKAKYGTYLIKNLSKELSDEFGTGFSIANLKNCRQFYLTFPKNSYGFTMSRKVPWSHLRNIMRIANEEERNFYLNEVVSENWSVRTLERNIKSGYYKRKLSTQLTDKDNKVLEFVKDPFVLEFMGIKQNDEHRESDIEKAVISNLQNFC